MNGLWIRFLLQVRFILPLRQGLKRAAIAEAGAAFKAPVWAEI